MIERIAKTTHSIGVKFFLLLIFLLVLSYNLIGDGLRDVLDPRTKR